VFLASVSVPFVLCFAVRNGLPLHVVWGIRSATSRLHSVGNHVSWSAFRIPSLNHERVLGCPATSETRRAAQEQQNQDLFHILFFLCQGNHRHANPCAVLIQTWTPIPNYTRVKVVSCELQSLSKLRLLLIGVRNWSANSTFRTRKFPLLEISLVVKSEKKICGGWRSIAPTLKTPSKGVMGWFQHSTIWCIIPVSCGEPL
jgi:hypothetical protein